jgi:hypothetical protein
MCKDMTLKKISIYRTVTYLCRSETRACNAIHARRDQRWTRSSEAAFPAVKHFINFDKKCLQCVETIDQLLLECVCRQEVWFKVMRRCGCQLLILTANDKGDESRSTLDDQPGGLVFMVPM